jgi:hypothetical protein
MPKPGQLASRTQLGAQRTPQVDRAAMMRPLPECAPQRWHHVEAVEKHRQLGSLMLGKASHVAVPQYVRGARARWKEQIGEWVAGTRLSAQ